jgi:glycosyltransferase involved in cell wall biosynthesis
MTLLQITNRIPYPLTDGGAIAVYNVTKYMHLAGNKVILASLNTNKHYQEPSVMEEFAEVHTTNIKTDLSLLNAVNNLLFSSIPYNIQRFLSQEFSELLQKLIQKYNPDIIQLEGLHLCLYIHAIQSVSKAPIILRAHNVEFEIWERLAKNEKNLLKKLYLKNLSKKIRKFEIDHINLLDGIIAISSKDAKQFLEWGFKGPITYVPVGVSEKWLSQPLIFEEPIKKIGFLGSLEWLPNVQGLEWFLNNIWLEFHKNFPKIELHIAGRNPSKKVLNWNYPNVKIHGEVPDALKFLQQFSLLIVPLLSGSGMRVKVIESMALGKCIITSNVGAEGIEIENKKNILIADTPQEWLNMLNLAVQNMNIIKEIGFNARSFVKEHYQWENLVCKMINFYQQFNVLQNA